MWPKGGSQLDLAGVHTEMIEHVPGGLIRTETQGRWRWSVSWGADLHPTSYPLPTRPVLPVTSTVAAVTRREATSLRTWLSLCSLPAAYGRAGHLHAWLLGLSVRGPLPGSWGGVLELLAGDSCLPRGSLGYRVVAGLWRGQRHFSSRTPSSAGLSPIPALQATGAPTSFLVWHPDPFSYEGFSS